MNWNESSIGIVYVKEDSSRISKVFLYITKVQVQVYVVLRSLHWYCGFYIPKQRVIFSEIIVLIHVYKKFCVLSLVGMLMKKLIKLFDV